MAPQIDSLLQFSDEPIPLQIALQANITGVPTPTVNWYRNDQQLENNTSTGIAQSFENTTALLTHPLQSDVSTTDKFIVEAINPLGRALSTIVCSPQTTKEVNNPDAPRILTPLFAQVIKTNATLKLFIKYRGIPVPTIMWKRNGQILEPGCGIHIETLPRRVSTMSIQLMDRSKGGKFEVIATNKFGEARSSASVLVCDLKETPDIVAPRFVIPVQPKLVTIGQVVILEALVQSTPTSAFTWMCHGENVKVSKEVRIVTHDNKSILIIRAFKKCHEGNFTCRAENIGGSVTSTASVRQQSTAPPSKNYFSPRITIGLDPITLCEPMQTLVLQCDVEGQPTPTTIWTKNGQLLEISANTSITQDTVGTCTLQIAQVNENDCGEYACLARNEYGQSITLSQVLVEGT